jgi:hypothetical protein
VKPGSPDDIFSGGRCEARKPRREGYTGSRDGRSRHRRHQRVVSCGRACVCEWALAVSVMREAYAVICSVNL